MSQDEPIIEGEVVRVEETQPVPAEPQPREIVPARPLPKALALLGAALAFAGREIVPRVAASLLDAWDRRATLSPGEATSVRPVEGPATGLPAQGSRMGRQRRHRGGR